jgi:hypothetical protein
MGRGRAKGALAGCLVAAVALLAAGCGESRHPNEQRASGPTRVSVTITENATIVQPTSIAMGQERSQQIPQNQNHPQPPLKNAKGKPLAVVFVIANQTGHETSLQLDGGSTEESSEKIPPRSPGTFQTELPAGTYTVKASGGEAYAPTGKLAVGNYRASSQNDLLLP